jgi:protein PhnA
LLLQPLCDFDKDQTMSDPTHCPKCDTEHPYHDGRLWNCASCGHEWTLDSGSNEPIETDSNDDEIIKDAFGNKLTNGDSVTVIKDLKIKGSSSSVKVGTKVKNIRLVDSSDGHNIACKIDGFGAMNLKSEFVKKS